MAENEPGLDDFFAKKDKSKKKSKAKFTVDDILQAKTENEEKAKKGKSSKKRDKDSNRQDKPLGVKVEGDEEWNDVEEESEKDYTGLRIQNLQITSKTEDDRQDGGASRNEEGDEGESREGAQGPWRPVTGGGPSAAPAQQPANTPAVAESTPEPPEAKSTGKYVPPAMRGNTSSSGGGGGGGGRPSRSKKSAPNVNSQEDFPTLGSVAEPCEGPAFEKIRGGARQMDDPSAQHSKVSTGNKFDALNDEDS